MLASSSLKVVYLWWTLVLLYVAVCAQACDPGWFGSSCQYKCHCTGNNCDNNGDCTGDSGCVPGWFGPQCQYVDLIFTYSTTSTPGWLRDGNDTSCNDDPNIETATVFLQRFFPFMWCRIHVENENLLENINVEFRGTGNETIQCNEKKNSTVDRFTIDIYCDLGVEIQGVVVSGRGVRNLCSVYLSGGRNVALKQEATQSSTYNATNLTPTVYGLASHAVDGDTDQNFQGGSCTHTLPTDNPNWNVTLSHSSEINRYVLYNRQDQHPSRLRGFILTSLENNVQVFEYQDEDTTAQSVYTITSVTNTSPITRVNIRHTSVGSILTLCEVEVYGDSVCSPGTYGRECQHQCDYCPRDKQCFVSTGGCPSGCTAGFMGDRCHLPCPDHSYGINCRHRCSDNCVQRECNASSGRCNNCLSGFDGDFCSEKCPETLHGPRCTEPCSSDCLESKCNGTSGNCIRCPPGYTGDLCKEVCPSGFYGNECKGVCGNCKNEVDCNPENGTCPSGCNDGYTGRLCDAECSSGTYGDNCLETCGKCKNISDCNPKDGTCTNGCSNGYTGSLCDAECEFGSYGRDCREQCSVNCWTTDIPETETPCHHVTGSCLYGCKDGYKGNLCADNAQDSTTNTVIAVVIGVAIGTAVTVIIVIIIVGVRCYRRRSPAKRPKRERPPNYDAVDPTSDQHNYTGLFRSADGYDLPTDLTLESVALEAPSDNIPHNNSNVDEISHGNMDETNLSRQEQDQHPKTGEDNDGYIDCYHPTYFTSM